MFKNNKAVVLIVDDSATVRNMIAKHLGGTYSTIHASNGEEAWQALQSEQSITLIFVDLHMPVMNGMMLLEQIRNSANKHISNLPVIMITGHEDTEAAKQASYNMGATDFICKPFSAFDILSRARSYAILKQKITLLEQNTTHDELTQLFNENGLQELAEKQISSSRRYQHELSIITMQIAGTNKTLSEFDQDIVKQIIISAANSIKKSQRNEDILAHLGSGKFIALLPMTKAFKAHIVALRFQKIIDNLVFKIGDDSIKIKLAIGLCSTEDDKNYITFEELSRNAEKALQVSLQHKTCRIVRQDELLTKEEDVEEQDISYSKSTDQNSTSNNSSTDDKKLSIKNFSVHMSAILNDDFEKIPQPLVKSMIEPLESFLVYARNLQEKQTKNS